MTAKTEAAIHNVLKFQFKWQPPQILDFIRQVKKREQTSK